MDIGAAWKSLEPCWPFFDLQVVTGCRKHVEKKCTTNHDRIESKYSIVFLFQHLMMSYVILMYLSLLSWGVLFGVSCVLFLRWEALDT